MELLWHNKIMNYKRNFYISGFSPRTALLRVFLIMGIIFTSGQAWATELHHIPPLKPVELMPQEEFEAATMVFEDVPAGDRYLSYRVRLPKGWTRGETFLEDKGQASSTVLDVLGNIGRYDGPPQLTARSYFTVQAQDLSYEVTAQSWFINHILENGFTVEGMDVMSDREVRALYVSVEGDTTYGVRMIAKINGPRIIVARYFIPQERFNEERVLQAQVIQTFALLDTTAKQIETRRTYSFVDQSYFDYPVSWEETPVNIASIERMRAEILSLNAAREMNGRIRVLSISKLLGTRFSDEVREFMASFSIKDYRLGDVIERVDLPHHPDLQYLRTEVYALNPELRTLIDYEVWASLAEGEEYYYIVSMLTPSRKQEFFTWTRNVEAYKVATSSLRRFQ